MCAGIARAAIIITGAATAILLKRHRENSRNVWTTSVDSSYMSMYHMMMRGEVDGYSCNDTG